MFLATWQFHSQSFRKFALFDGCVVCVCFFFSSAMDNCAGVSAEPYSIAESFSHKFMRFFRVHLLKNFYESPTFCFPFAFFCVVALLSWLFLFGNKTDFRRRKNFLDNSKLAHHSLFFLSIANGSFVMQKRNNNIDIDTMGIRFGWRWCCVIAINRRTKLSRIE